MVNTENIWVSSGSSGGNGSGGARGRSSKKGSDSVYLSGIFMEEKTDKSWRRRRIRDDLEPLCYRHKQGVTEEERLLGAEGWA